MLAGPRQRSGRTVRSTWRVIFTVRLLNTSELGILTAHPNGLDRIYQNRDFTRGCPFPRMGLPFTRRARTGLFTRLTRSQAQHVGPRQSRPPQNTSEVSKS